MQAVLILLLAAAAGCKVNGVFTCDTAAQCRLRASAGFCESTGFCSFVDVKCPSGHRYHETAGDLGNQCVDVQARKKAITINGSKVAGSLTGFPVWIDLTDPQIAMRAGADSANLEFTSADGSPIPYEIQRWDMATGRLLAWVAVPRLEPGVDTVINIQYGKPRTTAPAPAMVFANAFLAVWHCDDLLGTPLVVEATGMRTGTASASLDSSHTAAGMLGNAIDFGRNGVTDEVSFPNPLTGNSSHTISGWINARSFLPNSFGSIMTVGNANLNESRWLHTHFSSANIATGFYGNDWVDSSTGVENAGWTLLHWVFDSATSTSSLYRDGAKVSMFQHAAGISTLGTAGHIGNAPVQWGVGLTNPVPLNGSLDEVRIASAVRSAEWIATEFANQKSPSTFYTVGEEQLVE